MKTLGRAFRRNAGIWFVVPALVYMLAFVGYPIVNNIILSLQDVNVRTLLSPDKPFVAFNNYIEIFKDSVFRTSLWNTLIFTVGSLVFQFLIGFLLALFFSRNFKFAKPIRGFL